MAVLSNEKTVWLPDLLVQISYLAGFEMEGLTSLELGILRAHSRWKIIFSRPTCVTGTFLYGYRNVMTSST
jgi:hypothetical protein